jgi:aromatic ring-cleaving dioxygenase
VAKARAVGEGRALRRKSFGLRRRGLPSIADEELSIRQNRALVTAVPPAGPETIRHYHAHVYYDPISSRGRAARLRERVAAAFPDATLGRWHDAPVGPHPQSMYQIAFSRALLASFVPWLMLNRDGLTILLHPGTGNAYADHTDHAVWFGSMLRLRLDVLRGTHETPASDA